MLNSKLVFMLACLSNKRTKTWQAHLHLIKQINEKMNEALYLQKGFLSTLFTSVLIISIAVATDYFDSLFVPETGKLKIFGGIGIILAVGLVFKWKYVRFILSIIASIAFLGVIAILTVASVQFILPLSILLAALTLITYFLLFSKSVKTYVDRK